MAQFMSPYDSEQVLSEKFLLIGLQANKGNLSQIAEVLLARSKAAFENEVNENNLSLIDLISGRGELIFTILQKYFVISEDIILDWNLNQVTNPKQINIEWIKTQKEFLNEIYPDDFEELVFGQAEYDLLKSFYIVSILDKNIVSWDRDRLKILYPDYFTSSRKGNFYQNKKTRKLLSMSNYLHLLSDIEKKVLLSDSIKEYESLIDADSTNWISNESYKVAKKALSSELDLF